MKILCFKCIVWFVVLISVLIFGCDQGSPDEIEGENTAIDVKNKSGNIVSRASNPSLEEFIQIVETPEEIGFFQNTPITDNTAIVANAINGGAGLKPKPRIKFRWHGLGGGTGGCNTPLGICLIIPLGHAEANVDLMIYENKYILLYQPGQEDNRLTSDGYLPIMEDVYVDDNLSIASGIYKANFSEASNDYYALGIDIR